MANSEHVQIIKSGPEACALWREQNPDTALDLAGADLAGVDLKGGSCRVLRLVVGALEKPP